MEQEIGRARDRMKTENVFLESSMYSFHFRASIMCQALAYSLGTGDAPINRTTPLLELRVLY